MATLHGRYFQVALDAIEQFNRAENLTTLSNQLVSAASSFGYQCLCCLSAPGIQKRAAGKTAWDTGGILNIAEDTVNKHIASAMRKLNVYSRTQAVAESIRRGEIIP